MGSLACFAPLDDSLVSALAAAIIAAAGVLAAKHRPADRRTRATDVATVVAGGILDDAPELPPAIERYDQLVDVPTARKGRISRAARELRRR